MLFFNKLCLYFFRDHQVSNQSSYQGFTLIEVLIVVSLIILISGFSIAKYNDFNQINKLNKEAEQLYSVLYLARQKTISGDYSNQSCLEFNGYQIKLINSQEYQLQLLCPSAIMIATYNLDNNITISFTSNPIKFSLVNGNLDGPNDSITITVSNISFNPPRQRTITVQRQGQIILN